MERIVAYDNERGKGDHRHFGKHKEPYWYITPEQLLLDFLTDLHAVRGR